MTLNSNKPLMGMNIGTGANNAVAEVANLLNRPDSETTLVIKVRKGAIFFDGASMKNGKHTNISNRFENFEDAFKFLRETI